MTALKQLGQHMNDQNIEARIAAIEILLLTLSIQSESSTFKRTYKEQREIALIGLLNNETVSDRMHSIVEQRLKRYERVLGLDL